MEQEPWADWHWELVSETPPAPEVNPYGKMIRERHLIARRSNGWYTLVMIEQGGEFVPEIHTGQANPASPFRTRDAVVAATTSVRAVFGRILATFFNEAIRQQHVVDVIAPAAKPRWGGRQ